MHWSRTHPKVRAFVLLSLAHPWVIQILKAFCRALSLISCWVRNSKHLFLQKCSVQPVPRNESEEQMRTSTLSTAGSEWRIFVLCGLFKGFFLVFVLKQTHFVFLLPWLCACSEDSALAYQGSALMCSCSQWCFAKCSEGLGCFNNIFSCKMNSKGKEKSTLIFNTRVVVFSEDKKELLYLLMLVHHCSGGEQSIFEDKLFKFQGFCYVKCFYKCW